MFVCVSFFASAVCVQIGCGSLYCGTRLCWRCIITYSCHWFWWARLEIPRGFAHHGFIYLEILRGFAHHFLFFLKSKNIFLKCLKNIFCRWKKKLRKKLEYSFSLKNCQELISDISRTFWALLPYAIDHNREIESVPPLVTRSFIVWYA